MIESDMFDAPGELDEIDFDRAVDASAEESNWPQLLSDMLRVLEAHKKRRGMSAEEAFEHAREDVLALAEYFGGRMAYLPKGERLKVALRDAAIWRRFNGQNARELAMEYKLSAPHLYNVLARQRTLHVSKLQGRLFQD
jgi:Mor family transcriptional regulator